MANILKIVKDFNPKKALGSIFDKIDEILQVTNENTTAIAALPVQPKAYKALFTQSGSSTPTVIEFVDTLSATTSIIRDGAGQYRINAAGAFTENKTFFPPFGTFSGSSSPAIPLMSGTAIVGYYNLYWYDVDNIGIEVRNSAFAYAELSTLVGSTKLGISIEVYA